MHGQLGNARRWRRAGRVLGGTRDGNAAPGHRRARARLDALRRHGRPVPWFLPAFASPGPGRAPGRTPGPWRPARPCSCAWALIWRSQGAGRERTLAPSSPLPSPRVCTSPPSPAAPRSSANPAVVLAQEALARTRLQEQEPPSDSLGRPGATWLMRAAPGQWPWALGRPLPQFFPFQNQLFQLGCGGLRRSQVSGGCGLFSTPGAWVGSSKGCEAWLPT